MTTMTIDCPAELSVALGKRPDDAAREVRLMAALKLFEAGRISSGLAAKLAGMSRVAFLCQCGQYGVSIFQQNPQELDSDIQVAFDARRR
jgi:predicted HTH domain antitoxin